MINRRTKPSMDYNSVGYSKIASLRITPLSLLFHRLCIEMARRSKEDISTRNERVHRRSKEKKERKICTRRLVKGEGNDKRWSRGDRFLLGDLSSREEGGESIDRTNP